MNIIIFIIILLIIIYIINNKICLNNNIEKMSNHTIDTNYAPSFIQNEKICNNDLINIPKQIIYNDNKFDLIGTAINIYYNQNYYIYESKIDQYGDILIRNNLEYLENTQMYKYLFVNFIDNKQVIQWEFGPRNKINKDDSIYMDIKHLKNGISYIGPYLII